MSYDIRLLYINLVGYKKNPKQIFSEWNKYKAALLSMDITLDPIYPKYVKMAIKYEIKQKGSESG